MRRPRLVIVALVALHVLLSVVVVWLPRTLRNESTLIGYSLHMLAPSQGNLLGFWAALGGKHTHWRVMFAVVGVVAAARLAYGRDPDLTLSVGLLIWQTLNVGFFLLLARTTGLELGHPSSGRTQNELSPFQFSLGQVFGWTTTFAVCLTALHYLREALAWAYSDRAPISVHASCGVVVLGEHVQFVIDALKPHAEELGIGGR